MVGVVRGVWLVVGDMWWVLGDAWCQVVGGSVCRYVTECVDD